jgi:FtsP/CotA-like multicopper oxidase with cupredoxin domain
MERIMKRLLIPTLAIGLLIGPAGLAQAVAFVQCPGGGPLRGGDADGDGIPRQSLDGTIIDADDPAPLNDSDPNTTDIKCIHLTGGDGWQRMGDDREVYTFGFSDATRMPPDMVLDLGVFRANSPAPTIRVRERDQLYATVTNVGTHQRPDLFDPHSLHYHGFPNASAIFDGLPESAVAIGQGFSLTYYYNNVEPGTYMWHCHVEATEHMQMGMLGNLYVEPIQNQTGCPASACPKAQKEGGPSTAPLGYLYNDGDGSTGFDVEYALQLQAFDGSFHDASRDVQPLPFADMIDTYPTINGRTYPHTTIEGNLPLLGDSSSSYAPTGDDGFGMGPQPVSSLIKVTQGKKAALRISNLGVVAHYTLTVQGIPMRVVGRDARLLRGPTGVNVAYNTNVVNLGGGESVDVILDTNGIAKGTYFLHATNLNMLSNDQEDFGGYMTEIVVE